MLIFVVEMWQIKVIQGITSNQAKVKACNISVIVKGTQATGVVLFTCRPIYLNRNIEITANSHSLSRTSVSFTHTHQQLFTCRRSQLQMSHRRITPIRLHHLCAITETGNDRHLRLNESVLCCNHNMAFLGSPLSAFPLLLWLLEKSLHCPFVAKCSTLPLAPPPPKRRLCVCDDAGIPREANIDTCRTTLTCTPPPNLKTHTRTCSTHTLAQKLFPSHFSAGKLLSLLV